MRGIRRENQQMIIQKQEDLYFEKINYVYIPDSIDDAWIA
jgi:hypothetical protein